MRTVDVPLEGRAYQIRIGQGLLAEAAHHLADLLRRPRVAIVTEARVAERHLPALRAGLTGIEAPALVLEGGEAMKSWEGLTRTAEWLLDQEIERRDVVLAFGGGVVGDLAGFAAAVLRRGVDVVQVPTTLLAQVDSSVGGKTGINTRHGKNLVGAFHQPRRVLADTAVLETLSPRDFRAGYAEIAKYGLLADAGFFAWLETHGPGLVSSPDLRAEAVARACAGKAAIVVEDEKEAGRRALLNLGHTFGHALEAATGYSERLLHGEAVAMGCVLAADVSARLGMVAQEVPSRIAAHFAAMGLRPLADVDGLPDADALIGLMAQDKKVVDGRLAFILLRDIGDAVLSREVPMETVRAVLSDALG